MMTIGVVAPGAMGSAVSTRLAEHGCQVLTLLDGRSAATRARADAAGMRGTDAAGLMASNVILSIVPPGDALGLATLLAPAMAAAKVKPIYIDCNALDVRTVEAIERIVAVTGASFLDAGIIGMPPKPGAPGPKFYLSGTGAAAAATRLAAAGLLVEAMAGSVGAASALKMSYAGITKGLSALASVMILGAERAGAGEALRTELAASQPQLLARFSTALPDMMPKAYRWVAEMREIAAFLGDDPAGTAVFKGIAAFYERIAADAAGERFEVSVIESFLK